MKHSYARFTDDSDLVLELIDNRVVNEALICQEVRFSDDNDLVLELIDNRVVNEALICN